ncbi:hypothetical protein EVAR_2244_1 [Eumeta japonica]|uniref:Uncharacterized protein n=1 Tax=Eumeta variegata TaxID=151549 RepID=A0A4C1SFY7_EUMVA|nr:hypothetical protein EVAR_2244_1 [Eumeta japonica]
MSSDWTSIQAARVTTAVRKTVETGNRTNRKMYLFSIHTFVQEKRDLSAFTAFILNEIVCAFSQGTNLTEHRASGRTIKRARIARPRSRSCSESAQGPDEKGRVSAAEVGGDEGRRALAHP